MLVELVIVSLVAVDVVAVRLVIIAAAEVRVVSFGESVSIGAGRTLSPAIECGVKLMDCPSIERMSGDTLTFR